MIVCSMCNKEEEIWLVGKCGSKYMARCYGVIYDQEIKRRFSGTGNLVRGIRQVSGGKKMQDLFCGKRIKVC